MTGKFRFAFLLIIFFITDMLDDNTCSLVRWKDTENLGNRCKGNIDDGLPCDSCIGKHDTAGQPSFPCTITASGEISVTSSIFHVSAI